MQRHTISIGVLMIGVLTAPTFAGDRDGVVAGGAGAPAPAMTLSGERVDPRDLAIEGAAEREDRAALVSNAFTYQGLLSDGGLPANGEYDMRFTLTDDVGATVAGPICIDNVDCTDGLFTVSLNFGAQFWGDARELSIEVRPGGALANCAVGGGYSTLGPRQRLAATPYALGLRLPYAGAADYNGSLFRVTNSVNASSTFALHGIKGGSIPFGFTDRAGVRGDGMGDAGAGVLGTTDVYVGTEGYASGDGAVGTFGRADGANGIGVRGWATDIGGIGVKGEAPVDGWAGHFSGRGYFSADVGIGSLTPAAKLDVAGKTRTSELQVTTGAAAGNVLTSDGSGNASWQSVPAQSTPAAFISGYGSDPTGTNAFLTPVVTVTITAGQKIFVSAHKAFGSTVAGGASSLNLWIGYRVAGSGAAPSTVGGGIFGNRVAQNTRLTFGLSAVITGLPAGSYEVGMMGSDNNAGGWNSNEYGYVTALVLN